MQDKKPMSWGWIIFSFIIWPVGLFFLFKKLSGDKYNTLENSKIVSIISYILMCMGVISLLMVFNEDSSIFVPPALLFGGSGILVNIVAKKMKINGKKYKKYINLVVNQQLTQIDNIALSVGVSYDVAKTDLQKLIDSGYFVGAYINKITRKIVLSKPANSEQYIGATQIQTQTKVVACKSCGANNTITSGRIKECEYCGSPVE